MEITTIKIKKSTKTSLDTFRQEKDSYDDTIQKLINSSHKKQLTTRLIKGYKNIGSDELKMLEEWDSASLD